MTATSVAEMSEPSGPLRIFVVLNPSSGSSSISEARAELARYFREDEFEVLELGREHDLKELVAGAIAGGAQAVMAGGGDGTISAVADALTHHEVPLVVIPLGTANVFARELSIPVNLAEAIRFGARALKGEEPHEVVHVDSMRIGDRHHLTQVGVGIDAVMIRDTGTELKKKFGRMAYLYTAATRLVGFQPLRFYLTLDGKPYKTKASQLVIANTGMMGQPPFRWGPNIAPDDGVLNVCLVRTKSAWSYLGIFWHVFRGHPDKHPNIRHREFRDVIEVKTRRPLPVQADGEIVGETPMTIRVSRRSLRVVVPPRPSAPR